MKDFAIKIREMLPEIDSGWDEDIERVLIEVAAQTRREALNEAIEYCAKYVSIKIDMRDGGFILMDRDGKRISLEEIKSQEAS